MAWLFRQPGSSHWWIGYRVNGKQIRRSTGTSDRTLAEQQLKRLDMAAQAHQSGALTDEFIRLLKGPGAAEMFLSARDQWLQECKDLSESTRERYKATMQRFSEFIHATEHSPALREIQPETVAAFIRAKRAATSAANARIVRSVLSGFFRWAADNRMISSIPVPSTRSLKLPKDAESGRRPFTLAELRLLHQWAPSDFWRYMVVAGFFTGQRMGDLICLRWGNLDLDRRQIHLTAMKTRRVMHIPLRGELALFLGELRRKRGLVRPGDYIWPDEAGRYEEKGSGPFSEEFYDLLFSARLVPAREPKRTGKGHSGPRKASAVTFHCLRHTFVTLLKASGGNQAVAKELAGHTSDAVSDLYTHIPEDVLSNAIAQLPEVT